MTNDEVLMILYRHPPCHYKRPRLASFVSDRPYFWTGAHPLLHTVSSNLFRNNKSSFFYSFSVNCNDGTSFEPSIPSSYYSSEDVKMKAILTLTIVVSMYLTGCHNLIDHPDFTPPSPPLGLRTATGDNFIELFWNPNPEIDVAGYNVFASSTYNGRYELIGSTRTPYFLDKGARNGNTYYYAVTAYDYEGNESGLSKDIAYDIPRPEGYNVVLDDYRQAPGYAGYDFSKYAVVPYNDQYADIYFENYNGDFYMNVRTDSDIQDMGPTSSLLDVNTAPSKGWSPTHDVRLYAGHTYVVWTWDDHYAKFRVTVVSPSRVVFDWAYQLQKSSPLLKRSGTSAETRPSLPAEKTH